MPKLYYLASPYSDDDPCTMEDRFNRVCKAAAELFSQGHFVFSPIAHTHPIAKYGLPKGFQAYAEYDRMMLGKCDELIVLRLEGWENSKGIAEEIKHAKNKKIPIQYL